MSSTNFVDFGVRQNKSIERALVFENLLTLVDTLALKKLIYVGLGSVWFADFTLAHKELHIDRMISVESDPIIYARAKFNKPYRTLRVIHGESGVILPGLLKVAALVRRPWVVWLDYDKDVEEGRRDELAFLIRNLPNNSFLIVTCNAQGRKYGQSKTDRVATLNDLLGDAVEAGLTGGSVDTEVKFMNVLRGSLERFMISVGLQSARPGGYQPAFNMAYQDGTPMVTVGGFLPSPTNAAAASLVVASESWTGRQASPIITPPLTAKEVAALQAQLPRSSQLTRKRVQGLGFDLADEQIELFERYYLKYPVFAQVAR